MARTYILGLSFTLSAVAAACGSDDGTQKNPSFNASSGGGGATSGTGGKPSSGTGGVATGGKANTGGGGTGAGGSGGGAPPGGGGADPGGPDGSAGGADTAGDGGADGSGGAPTPPYDCVLNPTTHLEIINACTDAVRVEKHPALPPLPR